MLRQSHNQRIHVRRIEALVQQLVPQLHEAVADQLSLDGGQQDGIFSLRSEKHVQHPLSYISSDSTISSARLRMLFILRTHSI